MKLAWASDVHLNFLRRDRDLLNNFYRLFQDVDAILLTGDIAEGESVASYIEAMQSETKKPVYFVLGNHDFYGSSVKRVRKSVKHLHHLAHHPIELNRDTTLIGVDGWGDCRNGDFEYSRLYMNDWNYIEELREGIEGGKSSLKNAIQKLADSDARKLKKRVQEAVEKGYKKIIIATHVPPMEEVCLNAGRKSTPDGLPFFSSKCLINAILPIAEKCSNIDILWLSGHTHSRAEHRPCSNMILKVAESAYGMPQVEEILHV